MCQTTNVGEEWVDDERERDEGDERETSAPG